MGYVERLGSGIARMRQVVAEAGLPPPRFTVSADAFRISLETWAALGLGSETAPVLDAVRRRGHVTAAMVAGQLKVSRDTAQRLLNTLVEAGLIERVGEARSTRYILKGAQP